MTQMAALQVSLALLPIPLWLFDARGKLQFANSATLALFDVADQVALMALIGGTITEQAQRLHPRQVSPATIAKATEESIYTFTPERLVPHSGTQPWGSMKRRNQAAPLRADDLPMARALKKKSAPEQLLSLLHPTRDAEIIVRASATPVLDAEDRVQGAVLITLDATRELLEDGRRDAVLALAGHDIRNPLTPARGYLQQLQITLAREGDRFQRQLKHIESVLTQLDRIAQIANDLDAIAVNERGETFESMATCDLVALCRQVAVRQQERRPEVHVVVTPPHLEPMRGVWSRLHLERALVMLVDSAARRSPVGGTVTMHLKRLRREFKVEITDQGLALSPDRLEALRAVLSRGGAALALSQGWDLDLSTVQTILALNRSRLSVTSRARSGTTFWFALQAPLPDPVMAI
jgi:signal transduction histidine kinase